MGATTENKPAAVAVNREQRRNDALKRAIAFSKFPLITGLLYFAWRTISIILSFGSSSWSELAVFIGFFVVEWTFASESCNRNSAVEDIARCEELTTKSQQSRV
jgi:hypothetical protein